MHQGNPNVDKNTGIDCFELVIEVPQTWIAIYADCSSICEHADKTVLFFYEYGRNFLQRGTAWGELTLENVRFTDLKLAAVPFSEENTPLQIILKDVSWTFHESVVEKNLIWLREDSNAVVIEK